MKIKELFRQFIDIQGITEEDLQKNSFSGTVNDYLSLKNIFKIYKHIVAEDYDKATFQFNESLKEIDFSVDLTKMSNEQLQKTLKIRDIYTTVSKMYEDTKEEFFDPILNLAKSHDFFKDEKIEEIPPTILLDVSTFIESNYFKKYTLKEGTSQIPNTLNQFQLSTKLYMSDNINYFLENFNKEYDDDIVRITTFFKIEKEPEYSYFMFIMNYKDHVIAYSDLLIFDNPHMVTASRNPRRKVESKHEESGLPYVLIDKLEDIRKKSTDIATIGNSAEFHQLEWSRFSQYQRLFTLLFCQSLVSKLNDGESKLLVSSEKFINQKLLEGKDLHTDSWNDESFEYWNDSTKSYAKDLVNNMIDEKQSTELMKVSYDIISNNENFDSTMIAPIEIHQQHANWIAVNEQRFELRSQIGIRYNGWDSSMKARDEHNHKIEQLHCKMQSKFDQIIEKLTQAENLYFLCDDQTLDSSRTEIFPFRFYQKHKEDEWRFPHTWLGSKYGWSDRNPIDEACPILPQYKGSSIFYFEIRHYSQLMYLLDCTREELPHFYRCYKRNSMVPYGGNSILSNVHPFTLLYDPCSIENPNQITFSINMSKRGYNKIVKTHKNRPENKCIDINGNEVELDKSKITHGSTIIF